MYCWCFRDWYEIWFFLQYYSCLSEKYNSGFWGQLDFVSKLPLCNCRLFQYDQHAEVKAYILPTEVQHSYFHLHFKNAHGYHSNSWRIPWKNQTKPTFLSTAVPCCLQHFGEVFTAKDPPEQSPCSLTVLHHLYRIIALPSSKECAPRFSGH